MQLIEIILSCIAAGMIVGAGYYRWKARRHLSAEGMRHPTRVHALTVFADRSWFTDEGWRYFNRFTVLALAALFLLIVLSSRWCARTIVQQQMRLRAGRPQLKRDPLGSHHHPYSCKTSGARRLYSRESHYFRLSV